MPAHVLRVDDAGGTRAIVAEPRRPHLLVLSGSDVGNVICLDQGEMILGRDPTADIRVFHGSVSRRHARLTVDGERVAVEDLDSKNGTYVGIRRIDRRWFLNDGDALGLGLSTLMKVTCGCAVDRVVRRAGCLSASGEPSALTCRSDYILDRLGAECGSFARGRGTPLALVFIRADIVAAMGAAIDTSELANEMMGDVALAIYEETVRTEDFVGRSGPDAFLCIARSDATQAAAMAERVRLRVSRVTGASGRQTVTAVVVPLGVAGAIDPEEALAGADDLARLAMEAGTDRVAIVPALTPLARPNRGRAP